MAMTRLLCIAAAFLTLAVNIVLCSTAGLIGLVRSRFNPVLQITGLYVYYVICRNLPRFAAVCATFAHHMIDETREVSGPDVGCSASY